MRFKILGANMETGDDVDVIFDAPSQADVEKLAHEKGILVSSIAAVAAAPAAPGARAATGAPVAVHGARAATGAPIAAPGARAATGAPVAVASPAPGARAATGAPIAAPGARAATGAPIGGPTPHKPVERDLSSISLIDDDPPADPANASAPHAERAHGLITVNANSPGETAHTGAGSIDQGKHAEVAMEYHVILNQSLFLLESTVNKHLRDGWEPSGGLTVGVSNNALQFFQAMVRKKKAEAAK
jgi:hypothetical protein